MSNGPCLTKKQAVLDRVWEWRGSGRPGPVARAYPDGLHGHMEKNRKIKGRASRVGFRASGLGRAGLRLGSGPDLAVDNGGECPPQTRHIGSGRANPTYLTSLDRPMRKVDKQWVSNFSMSENALISMIVLLSVYHHKFLDICNSYYPSFPSFLVLNC